MKRIGNLIPPTGKVTTGPPTPSTPSTPLSIEGSKNPQYERYARQAIQRNDEEARIDDAVQYLINSSEEYALARGDMEYWKERVKASLHVAMAHAPGKNLQERQGWAYENKFYIEACDKFRDAVVRFNTIHALRDAERMKIEVWRTRQANERSIRL